MVSAEQARNLVRQAGLTKKEVGQMLLYINMEGETTLPMFDGLHVDDVADTARAFLENKNKKHATSDANMQQELVAAFWKLLRVSLKPFQTFPAVFDLSKPGGATVSEDQDRLLAGRDTTEHPHAA